jgi:hypothetical protein
MITHAPPLLVTIRRRGYVRWWLKHFGHFKKGGTCNIIFEKNHPPPPPPSMPFWVNEKLSIAIQWWGCVRLWLNYGDWKHLVAIQHTPIVRWWLNFFAIWSPRKGGMWYVFGNPLMRAFQKHITHPLLWWPKNFGRHRRAIEKISIITRLVIENFKLT